MKKKSLKGLTIQIEKCKLRIVKEAVHTTYKLRERIKMENKKLDYKLITELYEAGHNMTSIAKMVNSVNGHISKVLRKEGVQTRKRGEISNPLPLKDVFETKEEKCYMYELLLRNGYSQYDVADIFGQAQSTVSKTLKAYRLEQEAKKKEAVAV